MAEDELRYNDMATLGYMPILAQVDDLLAVLDIKFAECQTHLDDLSGGPVFGYGNSPNMAAPAASSSTAAGSQQSTGQQMGGQSNQTQGVPNQSIMQNVAYPAPNMMMPWPQIELPQYDGSHLKYTEFMDTFLCTVDNTNMPDVLKFHKLKGALLGRAASAISGLTVSNASYPEALSIIQTRFGNQLIVSDDLYDELRQLPVAADKAYDLRKLVDSMDQVIRLLKTMGQRPDDQTVMARIMEEKLPDGALIDLDPHRPQGGWNLTNLCEKLKLVVASRERLAKIKRRRGKMYDDDNRTKNSGHDHKQSNTRSNTRFQKNVFSVSQSQSNTRPQANQKSDFKPKRSCAFCGDSHFNDQCTKYTTVETRMQVLREKKCCFRCGRDNHQSKQCRVKVVCFHCKRGHMTAMCYTKFGKPSNLNQKVHHANAGPRVHHVKPAVVSINQPRSRTPLSEDDGPLVTASVGTNGCRTAALMVVNAQVFNPEKPEKSMDCVIFFDNGSQRTFVSKEMCTKLGLSALMTEQLDINSFGSSKPRSLLTDRVEFSLLLKDGKEMELTGNAVPQKFINHPQMRPELSADDLKHIDKMNDMVLNGQLNDKKKVKPDILIGSEYFWDFMESKPFALPSGLKIIQTKLGAIVTGSQRCESNMNVLANLVSVFNISAQEDEEIEEKTSEMTAVYPDMAAILPESNMEDYSEYWIRENAPQIQGHNDNDDEIARKYFYETAVVEDGKITVSFARKNVNVPLSDNAEVSIQRFRSLDKRLSNDTGLFEEYKKTINEYLKKGIIEPVPEGVPDGDVCYLPHHPVLKPERSTTKCRIVFDASAKSPKDGSVLSLNESLYRGPVKPPLIPRVLNEFRMTKYVCISDVEKAFLNIRLDEKCRDLCRFWWYKNDDKPGKVDENLTAYRFTRVLFGLVQSSYLLEEATTLMLSRSGAEMDEQMKRNMYVDNAVITAETEEELFVKKEHFKKLFGDHSMNLRQFLSNSALFNSSLTEADKTDSTNVKMLGVPWDAVNDTLTFVTAKRVCEGRMTKRMVARSLATTYDVLGMLTPITLQGKLLLNELFRDQIDWDENISVEQQARYEEIMQSLSELGELKIQRYLGIQPDSEYELHCFTDASMLAYACAVYVRFRDQNGEIQVKLLIAKNRLAPSSAPTVPKMELLGIQLGVELLQWVTSDVQFPKNCKLTSTRLWSDSKAAIGWCHNEKPLSTFVDNRVQIIRRTGPSVEIRFCPGAMNPADVATRGLSASDLKNGAHMWWTGAEFLKFDQTCWPENMVNLVSDDELEELARERQKTILVMESKTRAESGKGVLFDISRFSSFEKLVRVAVLTLRVVERWTQKVKGKTESATTMNITECITAAEVEQAEIVLLKQIQKEIPGFDQIMDDLTRKQRRHQLVMSLNLAVDRNGLIRSQGRFKNAETVDEKPKYPILLPKDNPFTELVIRYYHNKNFHMGVQQTLTDIRTKYWIIHGKAQVKKSKLKCVVCKRAGGGAFSLPTMPPLQSERINRSTVFERIGVDMYGPTMVTVGAETKKAWVVLFTCLTTRMVHLEYVLDLSTFTYLRALRRFISLYTCPTLIISDNASTFKLAEKTLETLEEVEVPLDNVLMHFCAFRGIRFKYINAFSPHEGGFYERLIQICKRMLNITKRGKLMEIEEFRTVILETQSIANRRPLTTLYDEPESMVVIRPIDFLLPGSTTPVSPLTDGEADDPDFKTGKENSAKQMKRMWESKQVLLDKVWKMFETEYFSILRKRRNDHERAKPTAETTPKLGEVVLIHDNNHHRNYWKLGRISNLRVSADGETRSAEVQLPNGKLISRSLKLLYPLEVTDKVGMKSDIDTDDKCESNDSEGETMSQSSKAKTQTKGLIEKPETTVRRSPRFQRENTTHNLTSNVVNMLLFALVMSIGDATLTRPGECMDMSEHHDKLQLVATDKCVEYGHVIFKEVKSNKLCWLFMRCENGKLLNEHGICDTVTECACPNWATGCSHTPVGMTDELKLMQAEIGLDERANICSFEPEPRCAKESVEVSLPKIEFLNGEYKYVQVLNVEIVESLPGEFTCIGVGTKTGTVAYCERHPCSHWGTQLCWNKHRGQGYYVEGDKRIPIRTWGAETVKIWPYKKESLPMTKCSHCEVKCLVGGINVQTEPETSLVEICVDVGPICYSTQFPEAEFVFMFDPEITMHKHEVHVQIWRKGILVYNEYKICESQPFCETVSLFSWSMIQNWHCAPRWVLVLIFVMINFSTLSMFILYVTIQFGCGCLKSVGNVIWNSAKLIIRKCCRKTRKRYLPLHDTDELQDVHIDMENQQVRYRPTRRLSQSSLLCIMVVAAAFSAVQGCSEFAAMMAHQTDCVIVRDVVNCTISETVELALAMKGEESCLSVNDLANKPVGMLKIELQEISLMCEKTDVFYTRDFEVHTASVKRCPSAGTCQNANDCNSVQSNTLISELNGEPNQKPGITGCASSCACFACGCLFCTESCTFYRTYVTEKTDVLYELFECSTFRLNVNVTVKYETHDNVCEKSIILMPGVPRTIWPNVILTLKSLSLPTTPVLGKRFVSNGEKFVVLDAANSQTSGLLKCVSREAAARFECMVDQNMCVCTPRRGIVACSCNVFDLADMFTQAHNMLPMNIGNVALRPSGDSVKASFEQLNALVIQTTMKGMSVISGTIKSRTKCKAQTIGDMTGCYRCLSSAKASIKCTSDYGDVLGTVTCQESSFGIKCAQYGYVNNVSLRFNNKNIDEKCELICPGGVSEFKLKGILIYSENKVYANLSNSYIRVSERPTSWDLWEIIPTTYVTHAMVFVVACALVSIMMVCWFTRNRR